MKLNGWASAMPPEMYCQPRASHSRSTAQVGTQEIIWSGHTHFFTQMRQLATLRRNIIVTNISLINISHY